MEEEVLTVCPHCNVIWGSDEIDWQQCQSCGYPDYDVYDETDEWED